MIKCGHCGNRHSTINEVRECSPAGGGAHASVWLSKFQGLMKTASGDDAQRMMGVLKWVYINRPDIARCSPGMYQAAVCLYTGKISPARALQARFA